MEQIESIYEARLKELEQENQAERTQRMQWQNQAQSSMFSTNQNEDLIRWQLDLQSDLIRIEHLLRGHVMTFDQDGNEYWKEPTDKNHCVFNEHGVQLIMNTILFYINRNTVLSNYDEPTIKWKMHDFSDTLADLIYMKYEEMGMDTYDKRKNYEMICRAITDTVHSAYLRALNGAENVGLRTARYVTQTDSMSKLSQMPQQNQGGGFSILRPSTWRG